MDTEVIQFFVQISRTIGQRPSVGEIYGLLFISPKPLTFDDLIERLQLSNGAASEGLKYLRDLGAVRVVEVAGARRTHYEALAELRKLAGLFLRRRMEPHLSDGKSPAGTDRGKSATTARRGEGAHFGTNQAVAKLGRECVACVALLIRRIGQSIARCAKSNTYTLVQKHSR